MMKQLRIMVVDDDRDFAESMGELVEMNGHQAKLAFNGMNAINLFKQNNIDLILMDIRMPGLDGIETLKEVKKLNPDIPVAMMTGYSDQLLIDAALKLGVIGVLDKPVKLNQLKNIIKSVKKGNKILILDDDKDYAESLKEILEQKNYEVIISCSIDDAFHLAQNNIVDLFLFDLKINGKNGIDLWHMLLKEGIRAPVIFLTGFVEDFSREINEVRLDKNVRILEKPFDPDELLKILHAI